MGNVCVQTSSDDTHLLHNAKENVGLVSEIKH